MTGAATTAAWVAGVPVSVAEVDATVAQLRAGAFGHSLPGPHTAEGRNARRWVVQLVAARRLVERELDRRGRDLRRLGPVALGEALSLRSALRLGGVAAGVLAATPGAVELAADLTRDVEIPESDVRRYYESNPDLFADRSVSYPEARAEIATELTQAARDRAFGLWLEARMAEHVRLAPGFEHPAHPGHPDATHHH